MEFDHLMETAKNLVQPSAEATEEYSQKKHLLLSEINTMFSAREDLEDLIGPGNENMMRDNHHNHLQFMESVFTVTKPEILVETVIWVFRAYRSRGFQSTYWAAQLSTWNAILERHLTKDTLKEIWPFYQWMIVNTPLFTKLSEDSG